MWVIFFDGPEGSGCKKFALELSGEETLADISRVLSKSYNYSSKINYTFNGKHLTDTTIQIKTLCPNGAIGDDNSDSPSNLIQLKMGPDRNDQKHTGPTGEVYKVLDISIGRHFKEDDKLSPSQRQSSSRH